MLHLLSGLYNDWTHVEPYRIVLLGHTGHGKSGLLGSLSRAVAGKPGLPITSLRPTLGQSVVELPLPLPLPKALTVQVQAAASNEGGWLGNGETRRRPGQLKFWDLGASADLAKLWPRYYDDTDCVVFVVDSSEAFSWLVRSTPPFVPQTPPPAQTESSPAADRAWNQLATILSHPALREKPVLIAVSKVDTLPLGVSDPPTEVKNGAQLEPTAPGSPLDHFEERVRAWFAERFAQAGATAQPQPESEAIESTTEPTPPTIAPEQQPTSLSAEAKPDEVDPPPAAGPDDVTSAGALEPPSDPLQAAPASTSSDLAPSLMAEAREDPEYKQPPTSQPAIPAEPQSRPDDDTRIDPQAIAQRYWEVVAVSAVSLYVDYFIFPSNFSS